MSVIMHAVFYIHMETKTNPRVDKELSGFLAIIQALIAKIVCTRQQPKFAGFSGEVMNLIPLMNSFCRYEALNTNYLQVSM